MLASTVRTRAASAGAAVPRRAMTPMRSALPGWPYSASACAADQNTDEFWAGFRPELATPTTVYGGWLAPARRTWSPVRSPADRATPAPTTIWRGPAGAWPESSVNGVSAALGQSYPVSPAWPPVTARPPGSSSATGTDTCGIARATPGSAASRAARPAGTPR